MSKAKANLKVQKNYGEIFKMEKKYKVIPCRKNGETRYVIVSADTGEVLDDAQGYGYHTAQKAHAAYAYKTRDKSKDAQLKAKQRHIEQWLKEHKDFFNLMDAVAFDIAKGSWGPNEKFDAGLVNQMLKENNLKPDFSAGELIKVWRKIS